MANRTVHVDLALEVNRYQRGAAVAKNETRAIKREVEGLNREAEVTATRFKKAADEMGKFTRDAGGRLHDSKGRFAKEGAEAGAVLGKALTGSFGKMLMALPPQVKAVLAGAALLSAPVIASALSAGVMAGLGTGAVAAGVMLAARDARVKAAGKELGHNLFGQLQSAASPFIQPTLRAIGILRQASLDVGTDIQRIFAAAARYVEPLAHGLAGMIRNIMPALAQGVERAKPVLDVLARGLPRIGAAIASFLDSVTANADDAAGGMELIIQLIEKSIIGTGRFIGFLTGMFSTVLNVALGIAKAIDAVMPDWHPMSDHLKSSIAGMEAMKATIQGAGSTAQAATGWTVSLGNATAGLSAEAVAAANAYVTLDQRMRAAAQGASSYMTSMIGMEQAIDDATKAAKENGKTTDINTAKGRANMTALDNLAASTRNATEAIIAQKGSQGEANEVMARGRQKFIATAMAMGMSKAAAAALATQLGLLPKAKTIPISTPGMAAANSGAAALKAKLDALRSKTIRINTHYFYTSSGDFHVPGGTITQRRWGGVTERARFGLLREAKVYSPQGPARYAFAEPATQGEAFVPKRGDYGRSMRVLNQAAGWYGAQVVPRQMVASSSRTTTTHQTVNLTINAGSRSPEAIANEVGKILAKQADLYQRGG